MPRFLPALLALVLPCLAAAEPARILIVVGPSNHPAGSHEVAAGGRLMKYCLEHLANVPGVQAEMVSEWPADEATLDAVSSVVCIGDQFPAMRLPDSAAIMARLGSMMRRGCGLVCVHYATGLAKQDVAADGEHPLLHWLGGYFATGCAHHQSIAKIYPAATITPAAPTHPIARGWREFTLNDEPYINNYFGPDGNKPSANVTVLATSLLPPESPQREPVAWCVERADSGRGFGIVMPHFFRSWKIDDLRRFILNGIVWTAKIEVPPGGVQSTLPDLLTFEPASLEPKPPAPKTNVPPIRTGPNADLGGHLLLPPADAWNRDISGEAVDPRSDAIIAGIGADKPLHEDFGVVWKGMPAGIPYAVVGGGQPRVPIAFESADESDPGPYPIPPDAPIEGGPQGDGDRHVLVLDRDHWQLYELFHAFPVDGGKSWRASSGAIFDLKNPKPRPAGWTSADAAGLPILPGLARYDEICGTRELRHALRFTVKSSRHAYVAPASHFASSRTDENLPPMGMRVRLKAGFDTSTFTGAARVMLEAMKKYGLILADNGGDWFISGAPDSRWVPEELLPLRQVKGRDLEVVGMGTPVVR